MYIAAKQFPEPKFSTTPTVLKFLDPQLLMELPNMMMMSLVI